MGHIAKAQETASPRYVTTRQLADILGVSVVSLELWRRQGRGPAYIRLGRAVRYDMADVETWVASQRRGGAA